MFYFDVDRDIQLRLLEPKYSDEIFLLVEKDRGYLREWLPWVDGIRSSEDVSHFIRSTLKQFADHNGFHAAIFYRGEIAGCIGLHGIDWSDRNTSIGYWLSSGYQGNGIMTKSCRAIINYVLDDLGLNRVEIRVAEFNKRSRAIPERLGFTQEGIIRQAEWLYDHYVDHVVYGMLSEEWKDM